MKRYLGPLLAGALVLAWIAFGSNYSITLGSYVLLSALVALGLVLMTGYAGLMSFGQAAFVGIGAYTAGYLGVAHGAPGWITFWASLALSVGSAAALGLITLSMGGHYLSLATLAWSVVVFYALSVVPWLGGFNGLAGIPPLEWMGMSFASERSMLALIAACFAVAWWMTRNLLDSRHGRAVRAMRANSMLPEAFGAAAFRLKLNVFCHAAALAGVSGWLFAYMQRFLNPTPFGVPSSVEYLSMAVIGGVNSLAGALTGATVVIVLKQALQGYLPELLGRSGNFEVVVFGIVVLLVLTQAPSGLWPFLARLLPRTTPRRSPSGRAVHAMPARAPARPVESTQDALVIDGVCKHFGGLVAVSAVSFSVRTAEIVALLGPNGAGKSTMINMITGVLPVTQGSIRLFGRAIDGLSAARIASMGLARTFQHVSLVGDMSVLDNVMLGCHLQGEVGWLRAMFAMNRGEESAMRAMALEQLQRCGLAAHAQMPAASLALGQQRVLEIARALCAWPRLLLLDEPAAGLRLKEKEQLAQLLRTLQAEGVSVLVIDHDMDFIGQIADRMVVMQFGRKIADGGVDAVRADIAVQQAYLGVEAA